MFCVQHPHLDCLMGIASYDVSAMIVDVWDFPVFFSHPQPHFKPLAAPRYIYCLGTQLTYTYEYVYIH